jgi:hypothetical protein
MIVRDGRTNYRHFRLALETVQLRDEIYNVFFDARLGAEGYYTMRVTSGYPRPKNNRTFAAHQKIMFAGFLRD